MNEKLKKIFRNKIFITIGVLVLLGGLIALGLYMKKPKYTEAKAEMRSMSSRLEFAGNVEANETKAIYSVVNQVKVVDVPVKEGDYVKAGDVLVELDKTAITYDIKAKELQLEQAKIDKESNIDTSQSELAELNSEINNGTNLDLVAKEAAYHTALSDYQTLVYKWNRSVMDYNQGLDSEIVAAQNTLHSAQVAYCKAEKDGGAAVDTAEAEVETKKQYYEKLKASGATEPALTSAERAYKDAKTALEEAKTKRDTDVSAHATAVNNATATLSAADNKVNVQNKEYYVLDFIKVSAALADAEASLEAEKTEINQKRDAISRKLETQKASTSVSQAQVGLDHLKSDMENYTIKAPCNGYVSGLDIKVGDTVGSKVLMNVLNYDTMKVSIDVDEYDIGRFTMDTPVKIKINSLDKTYDGVVTAIAAKAEKKNDLSFIKITASFMPDERMSAGIGATVYTVEKEDNRKLCIPVDAVSYNSDTSQSEVTVVENGKERVQAVQVGEETDGLIVITEGLKEGDVVRYTEDTSEESNEDSSEESTE
ncbi:MAG: efflux RND transporter periplasmic adaptor subunit [Lachnospiraceae bacterium]|nr:efflux RND transporter periplasmic adaptor subunit [Lachnospiraceae bacterium]